MNKSEKFIAVMIFYVLLAYVIFPAMFYKYEDELKHAGYGFILGSFISIILWLVAGEKYVLE